MRLIAFTIDLGESPTPEQLSSVSEAAQAPSIAVLVAGGGATIIGSPDDVVTASVAAAHAARAAGAQIRCRVEPLGEATTDVAQEVAKAVQAGVTAEPAPADPPETAPESAPTTAATPTEATPGDDRPDVAAPASAAVGDDPLLSAAPLLQALSAAVPTPAGGSATAAAGAMAAAIAAMAARVALANDRLADVHAEMNTSLEKAERLRDELHALVRTDSDAYEAFMKASALPKTTEAESEARNAALAPTAMAACEAPLDVMRRGLSVLELCSRIARRGSASTRPDVAVAATLAGAATRGAWINVRVNMPSLRDMEMRSRLSGEAGTIARQAEETERHALRAAGVDAD